MQTPRFERRYSPQPNVFFAILFLSTGVGCAPNSYATPKTLAPTQARVIAASEYSDRRIKKSSPDGALPDRWLHEEQAAPAIPAILFRVGVARRVDIGLRVGRAASVDVKAQVLDGPLSIAVAPAFRVFKTTMIDVPVIVGYNFGDTVDIVLSPGLASTIGGLNVGNDHGFEDVSSRLARVGVGVRVCITQRECIQPEVTVFRSIQGDTFQWVGLGAAISTDIKP